ncbi:MAG: hypothetical protein IJ113_02660 [Eggerthellaceae bacterium]|nr:hypothetical protein [Eggerthellaceae bacterium]
MKARTFRLSESDIELLEEVAAARECSNTEVVRFAIHLAADEIHGEIRDEVHESGSAIDALVAQLAVKDEQIAKLQDLIEHEQLLRAQTVVPELPDAEKQPKQSWWRRWLS